MTSHLIFMTSETLFIGTLDIFIEVHKQHSSDGLVSFVIPYTPIGTVLACSKSDIFRMIFHVVFSAFYCVSR